jgi:hypothetical protein
MAERDSKTSFRLTKWYLDCVANSGDLAIVYCADLRWGALEMQYSSLLTARHGRLSSKFSIRGFTPPRIHSRQVILDLPRLGLAGQWQALEVSLSRTIFQSKDGSVTWECIQPKSEAHLVLKNQNEISGLGYVERLDLSIPPWQLPLEELHWGRFLSEHDSLVWIDWRGPFQRQLIVHNGQECPAEVLTESDLVLADNHASLHLDPGCELRNGKLGETVLSGVSRLVNLLPSQLLAVRECKWRSRGILRTGRRETPGWAIHEVVRWGIA